MAQDKKSVLLYCDLIHTVEKLDNETAGELFKHYLRYVNDLDPITKNPIVDIVFEPIKQNLKRDLKKWEKIKENKSSSGNLGNLKRWHLDLYNDVINKTKTLEESLIIAKGRKAIKPIANIAVKDTVTVTVKDTVNDILLKKETKELFNEWLVYRKEIKKPIKSEKTLIALAKKIEKNGFELSKVVINASIENGWQGLFWDKANNKTIEKPKKVDAAIILHKKLGIIK